MKNWYDLIFLLPAIPQLRGMCFELLPSAYSLWQQFKTLSPLPRANSLNVPKSHMK